MVETRTVYYSWERSLSPANPFSFITESIVDWKISPVLDVLLEIPELYDHFSGEHSESAEGIYDISNKQRLGLTEYQAVKQVKDFEKKK